LQLKVTLVVIFVFWQPLLWPRDYPSYKVCNVVYVANVLLTGIKPAYHKRKPRNMQKLLGLAKTGFCKQKTQPLPGFYAWKQLLL